MKRNLVIWELLSLARKILIESRHDFGESAPEVLVQGLHHVWNLLTVDQLFAGIVREISECWKEGWRPKTSIRGPWFPVNGVIKLPGWSGVGVSGIRCPEGTAVVA